MMIVLLAALAMLCGVSVGLMIGIVAGWIAFNREANNDVDTDYSGGM